jgi:valyl-tRNA synthetase
MQGYAALWVRELIHAGIATQIKVEEELRKEGLTRYDMGREKFLDRVGIGKTPTEAGLFEQLKTLGCPCDWERERFTMDEGCSRAVVKSLSPCMKKVLFTRATVSSIGVPKCTTALSDAEVET